MRRRAEALVASAFLHVLLWTTIAAAEAPVIPQYGPDKHEGVSSCHGSSAPRNDHSVRQDEVLIWVEDDCHS